ncbi:MAG TPA: GNAT family protein [Tepidiformaceae bacterium]|nr:GNAT family protein [Tepidiformaceae bacterium]
MLKGEKAVLRALHPEDIDRYVEFRNDVELELLASGEPPLPRPKESLRVAIDQHLANPGSDVWFAIETQSDFLGHCQLTNVDQFARSCELTIAIGNRDYQNRGFGRDAIKLLTKYAFRLLNMNRVWVRVPASNQRALRCFTACGFAEEGRLRQHIWRDGSYDDIVHLAVLRDHWNGTAAVPAEVSAASAPLAD